MADTTKEIETLPETSQKEKPKWHKRIPIETPLDLYRKDLTHVEIAKIAGCTHQNVTQRLQAEGITTLGDYRKNKDHVFEHLQRKIINSIDENDIKKAPFGSRITASAILEDKIRDLRGQNIPETQPLVVFVGQSVTPPEPTPAIDISHKIVDKPVDKE